jgi:hypothetical protein
MSVTDLPESEQPLSEQFRIVAKRWVDRDAAANLLEETKSAVLAQMMAKQGDMPVSRAEMNVKASEEWAAHIEDMVEARKNANLAKVQLDYIRMKHMEWTSANANQRHEARLSR